MTFSPDGRLLASSSLDHTVRLWDVANGWELAAFDAEDEMMSALAFSADGRVLVGARGHVIMWDTTTGRRLNSLRDATIEQLLVSADEQQLAVVRDTNAVELLDAQSGRVLKTFLRGESRRLDAATIFIAAAPDWRTFITYGVGSVRAWDVARGREKFALKLTARQLTVSNDGALVALTDEAQQAVKVFDATTGHQLWQQPFVVRARLAFSADGQQLTAYEPARTLTWAARTGAELTQAPGIKEDPQSANDVERNMSATISPDGLRYAYNPPGDRGTEIEIYERTGRKLRTLSGRAFALNAVAFSPDGRSLALGPDDRYVGNDAASDDKVVLLNYADGTQARALSKPDGAAAAFTYSPDGKRLAVAGILSLTLWDVERGTARELERSVSYGGVSFSPDGRTLAAYDYKALKLWDAETGRMLRQLAEHKQSIAAIAFSPDGKSLAVADNAQRSVTLLDVATGQTAHTLPIYVASIAFSPDSKYLVAGDIERRVIFIDTTTGQIARAIQPRADEATLIAYFKFAYSPDGKILAGIVLARNPQGEIKLKAANGEPLRAEAFIRLWDTATGAELRTLHGHTDFISALSFSGDGRLLLTGSYDRLAKLWDLATGAELAALTPVNQNDWLVTTPDGLFDGSPGAWQAILWRFSDKPRDVLPVEAFFNEFYYPNLLTELMNGARPVAPRGLADRDRRAPQMGLALVNDTTPNTTPPSAITTRTVKVKLDITAAPAGARDVRLFRNGSLVKAWRGDVLAGQTRVTLETTLPVVAGENHLTAYAFNRDNVKSPDAELQLIGATALKRKGIIYLLTIGVNEYENAQFNLKYAVADAKSFADSFVAQQSRLGRYGGVAPLSLTDARATKANILKAAAALAPRVQPEDAVIIYFAGHGMAHDNKFYLIPHDLGYMGGRAQLDAASMESLLAHSVSDRELEQAFEQIGAGLFLFVIDACHSGQAFEAEEKRRGPMNSKGLAQLAYEKGMYILTAAQSFQAAQEVSKLGHGLLTYTLIEEGLRQASADGEPKDGQVLLREWLDYTTRRVPEMQVEELQRARTAGRELTFDDGAQTQRTLGVRRGSGQRPRVFYRREPEAEPLVVARP